MVPETGRALERQREILEWKNPHLERFRRSPQLRRVLATAGDGWILEESKRPNAYCRGLVGSGGLLRPDQDLRDAGASRPKADQFLCRRAVESRRLGAFGGRQPRQNQIRQRHLAALPRKDRSALVRLLAERRRQARNRRSAHLPDRFEQVEELRPVAAAQHHDRPQTLFSRGRQALFRPAYRDRSARV